MPNWKKQVANLFWILFLACVLSIASSFVYFNRIWHRASPVVTQTHNTPLNNHGHVVYITENEFYWYALLFRIGIGGGISLMMVAFLLNFAGIPIDSEPTEKEIKIIEKILRSAGLEESVVNIRDRLTRRKQSKTN